MTGTEKDRPGVIAPPPLICLGFLLLGLGIDSVWPLSFVPDGARYPAGLGLFFLGAAVLAAAMRQFHKAGTNVNPSKPSTAIITSGLYRFSRNPIYVAMGVAYTGISIAVDSLWMLALLVPTLAVIRIGVIAREERYLERKFGDEYMRYKTSVRRWL